MLTTKDLQLPNAEALVPVQSTAAPKPKHGEWFLKGPIPLPWLARVGALKGASKAMAVAVVIWFQAGVENRSQVKLKPSLLAMLGIERTTAYRALRAMEAAGLVTVDRKRGRGSIVTIIDVGGRRPA